MSERFEIHQLRPFTRDEIWSIIDDGYETNEIYVVEKSESDAHTIFDIHLVQLAVPYQNNFYEDFSQEEIDYYNRLLQRGFSFGAYHGERLIGVALAEAFLDDRLLRVWEIHVLAAFRRQGVGRALMERVVTKAQQAQIGMIKLETQNTNVKAIRFYRSMGFTLDSIDMSEYFNSDEAGSKQIAFYMKRRLTDDELPGGI